MQSLYLPGETFLSRVFSSCVVLHVSTLWMLACLFNTLPSQFLYQVSPKCSSEVVSEACAVFLHDSWVWHVFAFSCIVFCIQVQGHYFLSMWLLSSLKAFTTSGNEKPSCSLASSLLLGWCHQFRQSWLPQLATLLLLLVRTSSRTSKSRKAH